MDMTIDKALDLALEALEKSTDNFPANVQHRKAITAIKQARSSPVQEPVATLWQHGETGRTRITMPGDITDCDARWFKAADLYTTPPAAQRQWVGLTDEQIKRIGKLDLDSDYFGLWYDFAKAIEAKLKEKNT
jgi:hypothetical protein